MGMGAAREELIWVCELLVRMSTAKPLLALLELQQHAMPRL